MRILILFFISVLYFAVNPGLGAVDASVETGNKDKTTVRPLWLVTEGIDSPESTYFDPVEKKIYVSTVGGNPSDKDGNGQIHKLDKNGKVLSLGWVTGLNAPKGLRAHRGILWTADIDQVVAIDLQDGKILKKIDVPGAKMLNDVVIDSSGVVYVSDTFGSKIFRIENDKSSVFIEGRELESPNGLFLKGNLLYVAAWGFVEDNNWTAKVPGGIYSIGLSSKQITRITRQPLGNLDGLEIDSSGNFIVSDWVAGKVYRVRPKNGKAEVLIYGLKGSADIGLIPSTQTLIIPQMKENKISAYPLSKL